MSSHTDLDPEARRQRLAALQAAEAVLTLHVRADALVDLHATLPFERLLIPVERERLDRVFAAGNEVSGPRAATLARARKDRHARAYLVRWARVVEDIVAGRLHPVTEVSASEVRPIVALTWNGSLVSLSAKAPDGSRRFDYDPLARRGLDPRRGVVAQLQPVSLDHGLALGTLDLSPLRVLAVDLRRARDRELPRTHPASRDRKTRSLDLERARLEADILREHLDHLATSDRMLAETELLALEMWIDGLTTSPNDR